MHDFFVFLIRALLITQSPNLHFCCLLQFEEWNWRLYEACDEHDAPDTPPNLPQWCPALFAGYKRQTKRSNSSLRLATDKSMVGSKTFPPKLVSVT